MVVASDTLVTSWLLSTSHFTGILLTITYI